MRSLEELIARQRFMLNRTTRAVKFTDERPGAEALPRWLEFEKASAEGARELAEFLEQITGRPFPMLYDAGREMLAARDELQKPRFEAVPPHDREALTQLLKAKDTIRLVVGQGNAAANSQLRDFDRKQAQKLRRLKDRDEKVQAEQLPERLRQLAKDEEFVYATIKKEGDGTGKPTSPSAKPSPGKSPAPARDDLKEIAARQSEIAEDAAAIEALVEKATQGQSPGGSSELIRQRMKKSVERAEQAADALHDGKPGEAQRPADEAARLFAELAVHTEGLLSREMGRRVAAARDLSARLAQRERDLADGLAGTEGKQAPSKGGGTKRSQPGESSSGSSASSPALAEQAARLAEGAETLADLLPKLAQADDPAATEANAKVEELLRETNAAGLARQAGEQAAALRANAVLGQRAVAHEMADRLEALSQRLEGVHRAIVAPKIAGLIALEQRAAELRKRLGNLQSQAAIALWHRDADALAADLAKQQVAAGDVERLQRAMAEQGWGDERATWNWVRRGDRYLGPTGYDVVLAALLDNVQGQVRELVLADLVASTDEPTPPQYKELVERYFQVLSQRNASK